MTVLNRWQDHGLRAVSGGGGVTTRDSQHDLGALPERSTAGGLGGSLPFRGIREPRNVIGRPRPLPLTLVRQVTT